MDRRASRQSALCICIKILFRVSFFHSASRTSTSSTFHSQSASTTYIFLFVKFISGAAEILSVETRRDICSLGIAHSDRQTILFSHYIASENVHEREFLFFYFFFTRPLSLSSSYSLVTVGRVDTELRVGCRIVYGNSWLKSTITHTDAIVCAFPGEVFHPFQLWFCWLFLCS